MTNQAKDLKQLYDARIFDYINTHRDRFESLGDGAEPSNARDERSMDLAQEILIFPARPWWFLLRPMPSRPSPSPPKPPGWTPQWQWRTPDRSGRSEPRWFDPKGGEFRWHPPDRRHPDGHWDYNPWRFWNDEWRNVLPPREGPFEVPPLLPGPGYIWA